jgi:hypothetical protein
VRRCSIWNGRACTLANVMMNGQTHRLGHAELGSWLPLHDAARKLGILEILAYRLISEGKLRSRHPEDGEIQVWVSEMEYPGEGISRAGERDHDERYLAIAERLASAVHHQADVLTNSLVAAYDRNAQLARENGALAERLGSVERELKELRDIHERLRAVESANAQLTQLLSTSMDCKAQGNRAGWAWLFGAGLFLLVLLLLAPIVALLPPVVAAFASLPA